MRRRYLLLLALLGQLCFGNPVVGTFVVLGPPRQSSANTVDYDVYRFVPGQTVPHYRHLFSFSQIGAIRNVTIFETGTSYVVTYKDYNNDLKYQEINGGTNPSGYILNCYASDGRWFSPTELLMINFSTGELVIFDAKTQSPKVISPSNFVPGTREFYFGRTRDSELMLYAPNSNGNDLFKIDIDGSGNATILESWTLGNDLTKQKIDPRRGLEFRADRVWGLKEHLAANGTTSALTAIDLQATGTSVSSALFPLPFLDSKLLGKQTSFLLMRSGPHAVNLDRIQQQITTTQTDAYDPVFISGNTKNVREVYGIQVPKADAHWKTPSWQIATQNSTPSQTTSSGPQQVGQPRSRPAGPQQYRRTVGQQEQEETEPTGPPVEFLVVDMSRPESKPVVEPVKKGEISDRELAKLFELLEIGNIPDQMTNRQVVAIDRAGGLDLVPLPSDEVLDYFGLQKIAQRPYVRDEFEEFPPFDPRLWAKAFGVCKAKTVSIARTQ